MIYRFEDFELDTTLFELRHAGRVLHMEPQVFSVLAHLIAHRDRVVSKIELLDEVWLDRFVSESALTSRIQAARKACGDSGREQRVIQTRHGRGYRFIADVEIIDPDRDVHRDVRGAAGVATSEPSVDREDRDVAGEEGGPGPEHRHDSIGREREADVLDDAIAALRTGKGATVLVLGAAGLGKSTLIEDAVERAEFGEDVLVLRARCRRHDGVVEPYVSLLDAIGRLGRDRSGDLVDAIERVAPTWLTQLPSLLDRARSEEVADRALGGTPQRMLREGVDLFETLARMSPVVFLIEDLHWADDSTLEVIEWLATRTFDVPLTTLGTLRTDDPGSARVIDLLTRVASAPHVERVELGPLDVAAIRALALRRLDAAYIDDDVVDLLTLNSAGNPLFAVEQLDQWQREGSVVVSDGRAGWADDGRALRAEVPDSVRRLIAHGIEQLDLADRELLEVAAVVGREVPAFAVAAGLDATVEDVERRLGMLAREGTLLSAAGDEVWPDGTVSTVFQLRHDLHQRTLYDGIPASRRSRVHQRIGERLEVAYAHRGDEHVTELAEHFLDSGDVTRAVHYLQRAGELALARSGHRDAVVSLRSALDLLANLPGGAERDATEVAIRASLGPALIATLGWGPEEVEENYRLAMDACSAVGPSHDRFIIRFGLASVHELRGEYNRSEELLREQLDEGPHLGVESQELLACSTFHQGAFDRSLEFARAGLDAWDEVEHSAYMARYGEHPGVSCNTWGALSAWHLGESELAEKMADRAVEWAARNDYARSTALAQRAFLEQYRGDPVACRAWAVRTIEVAEEFGFPFRVAQARLLIAWCDAVEHGSSTRPGWQGVVDAFAEYGAFGARMDEPYYLGLIADAAVRDADPETALEYLDSAAEVIDATTRTFFYEPELLRLRAVAVTQQGDTATASTLLDEAEALAARYGAAPFSRRIESTRAELESIT
jgi:DNA-binding winged helix-turn-helix (wHTH) protein/tetratricopeptide (TPR) repeat protein